MDIETKKKLYEYFSNFITQNKRNKFDEIIRFRMKYLTVVLEDIFQPHNASAVLRSCDCCGVQNVHIIENRNKYQVNPDVALGSSKWLSLHRYNSLENNTPAAIKKLKDAGYRIVATTPHKDDVLLNDLPVEPGPIALLFGKELEGLSDEALGLSDEFVKIPMYGFTESYNISVSAGISLFYLSENIRNSDINWQMNEDEILDIKIEWAKNVVKRSEILENFFLTNNNINK